MPSEIAIEDLPVFSEEVVDFLRNAAYVTLLARPDPENPDKYAFSLADLGFKEFSVNEAAYRFPSDILAGNRIAERVADIHVEAMAAGEDFDPAPGLKPPEALLDPSRPQPFIVRDGRLKFYDQAGTNLRFAGRGRSFPRRLDGNAQLLLAAVLNAFEGLLGTGIVNGHIEPTLEKKLVVFIVFRILEPRSEKVDLQSKNAGHFLISPETLNPPQVEPGLDPDFATLMVLGEPEDPAKLHKLLHDGEKVVGWSANEVLRLVDLDFDAATRLRCRPVSPSKAVGRFTATMHFCPKDKDRRAMHISGGEGVFEFHETGSHQRPIGTLRVDTFEGDVFPDELDSHQVYRFGAFGALDQQESTRIFRDKSGMIGINGAFSLFNSGASVSNLYILRIYDPGGAIRGELRRSWSSVDRDGVPEHPRAWPVAKSFTRKDEAVLERVEGSLDEGFQLHNWWRGKSESAPWQNSRQNGNNSIPPRNSLQHRFEIVRAFNPALEAEAYGFFEEADLPSRTMPVMGWYLKWLFDRLSLPCPRPVNGENELTDAQFNCRAKQLREYVFKYFLRAMDSQVPIPATPGFGSLPVFDKSAGAPRGSGFGYTQHYYKLIRGGIGKFGAEDQHAITDLRALGSVFEWIVLKVRLLRMTMELKPLGDAGPRVVFPYDKDMWLVLHRPFIVDSGDMSPEKDEREFGIGYAVLSPADYQGMFGAGPGRFDTGFKSIRFVLSRNGDIEVRMGFAVNRVKKFMNLPIFDPMKAAVRLADAVSFGSAGRWVEQLNLLMPSFLGSGGLDPLLTSISAAEFATFGQASAKLGISKDQLERDILVTHFLTCYQMVAGAKDTFRSVNDWLDPYELPEWIRTGTMPWEVAEV